MKNEARIGRITVGGQPSSHESSGGRFSAVVNLRLPDEEGNTTEADLRGSSVAYTPVPFTSETLSTEHVLAVRKAGDAAAGEVLVH